MVVIVRNHALKRKVFKELDKYNSEAMSAYKKGNMAKGNVLEKRADRLYAREYNKMFKVKR